MPWTKRKIKKIALLPDDIREKGEILLRNPRLGRDIIGTNYVLGIGNDIQSNCCGTVAFNHGIEYNPYNLHISVPHPPHDGGYCFPMEGRPGYIDSNIFEEMLESLFSETDSPAPGDIAVLKKYHHQAFRFWHTGTCIDADGAVLSQDGIGGIFKLENILEKNQFMWSNKFYTSHQTS